ncbi:MAG: radical SAM protein [Acidimicrobiales bacterium]
MYDILLLAMANGEPAVGAKGHTLRWPTASQEMRDTLFGPRPERHVGCGEYKNLEFLHVNARTIINTVPASSRLPFRYTINAYRGCSHACTYCMDGTTAVLMTDGTTKPLAEVQVGDRVFGTAARDGYRRCVSTEVLAHWRTVKPAWRVALQDGTTLVTSGDHQLLTRRGWKFVAGGELGPESRPHLSFGDELLGAGGPRRTSPATHRCGTEAATGPDRDSNEACTVAPGPHLRVTSVEALGLDMAMYDITTGTGDFIANGVVSHNCFARPTHRYLGLGIGEDFERRIVVKLNAVELARAELSSPRWKGDLVAMGTNTDPYQHAEAKYHLTRGIIIALTERRNPFSILTKSTLVLRDLPLLAEAVKRTRARVTLSVGTLDPEVWRLTEPGTAPPEMRLKAVRRLNEAGVPCGVLIAPVLPGLSDKDEQVRSVVEASRAAGAVSVSAAALHLRPGTREHYLAWLEAVRPDLVELYLKRFGQRAYQPKREQERLAALVEDVAGPRRRKAFSPRQAKVVPSRANPPRPAQLTIPFTACPISQAGH